LIATSWNLRDRLPFSFPRPTERSVSLLRFPPNESEDRSTCARTVALADWVRETFDWVLHTILRPRGVRGYVHLPKRWIVNSERFGVVLP
jgi:hypothetical protein